MFENVDGRRTDAGVIGILLAHPLAFRSGELKRTAARLLHAGRTSTREVSVMLK